MWRQYKNMRPAHGKTNVQQMIAGKASQINGKTFMAVVLIIVLVFMWIRVFINKGKTASQAQGGTVELMSNSQQQEKPGVKLVRIDLPFQEGRHDVITHDMFVRRSFYGRDDVKTQEEVKISKMSQSKVNRILNELNIDAIIKSVDSSGYQAFINGRLLKEGASLNVRFGGNNFKLKVSEISYNRITFKCNNKTISLKMSQLERSN